MPVECNWVGDYEDPAKLNRESRRGELQHVECICVCVHLPKSLLESVKSVPSLSIMKRTVCGDQCASIPSLILPVISITEK